MARSFNGSSDFGTAAVNLSSFNKLSVAFWLWQNAFDNNDELAMEYSTNSNSNSGTFYVDPNAGGHPGLVEISYIQIPTQGNLKTLARPSAAAWHHWVVLIDASLAHHQITHVYIDGVDQSLTERTDTTTAAANFGNFSMYFMSRAGTSLFNAGRMAEPALYGGYLLTSGDALGLAGGALPYQIGGSAPTSWWPFDGLQSPEEDFSHNVKNMTITGTTLVGGPPVMPFTPRWHRFLGWTPALPAAGLGWIINRRNKLMVPKKRA